MFTQNLIFLNRFLMEEKTWEMSGETGIVSVSFSCFCYFIYISCMTRAMCVAQCNIHINAKDLFFFFLSYYI